MSAYSYTEAVVTINGVEAGFSSDFCLAPSLPLEYDVVVRSIRSWYLGLSFLMPSVCDWRRKVACRCLGERVKEKTVMLVEFDRESRGDRL